LPRFRPLPQLSSRENETLQWMTEGKRNSEIAAILGISERTVEKHVAEVLTHLQAENRATAIIKAMEYCAFANMVPTAHPGASN
jgi:DNA-binding NarL/FixJ family response regulator